MWQYSVHWLSMHTCQIIHQADIGTPALTKHVYYGICVNTNASSRLLRIHHVGFISIFLLMLPLLPGMLPPLLLFFRLAESLHRVFLPRFFPPGGIWGAPPLWSWLGILIIAYNNVICRGYVIVFIECLLSSRLVMNVLNISPQSEKTL